MTDISRLCPVCLCVKDENGQCPDCGKDADIAHSSPFLPITTLLSKRYIVAKAQKNNSEGITYSAFDIQTNKRVSLREFFPVNLAVRSADKISVEAKHSVQSVYSQYLNSFGNMWTKLMKLKGLSALITVTDVFKANGTAYAVYQESEKTTLRDYLLETKEGFIPWEKARLLFMPVLSTLGTLHTSGIIHKGINPTAFIFSEDGRLKLTDFCIEPVRTLTGAVDEEFFDGYTPLEQYNGTEKIGPWSDIYSFCSVLYRSLIGTTPIDARTRAVNDQMMIPARFAEQLPPYVINALINGMEIEAADRTEHIEQLRSDLSASQQAIGASAPQYTPPAPAAPPAAPVTPPQPQNKFIQPLSEEKSNIPSAAKHIDHQIKAKRMAEKEEQQSKRKKIIIIAVTVCAVLAVAGIALLISSLTGSFFTESKVPDFAGMSVEEIQENDNYNKDFTIVYEPTNSVDFPANTIAGQSIKPGIYAQKGTTVVLYYSIGPKSVAVPDVSGKTYEEAERILTDLGFRVLRSERSNDDPSKSGTVIEALSDSGPVADEGSVITVVVYK